MKAIPLKTKKVSPEDSLVSLLDTYVPSLQEKDVLAVTSKIVSLCEKRVVKKDPSTLKTALIHQEADAYLGGSNHTKYGHTLTIKNNLLLLSAGIDESNGEEFYILYPHDIQASAIAIWQHLRQRDGLEELGVIITDSHTTPLRRGVTGIALGWCGIEATYSYINKPDVFGHPLRVTVTNLIDGLAATAVLVMGEGNEQTPLALIRQAPHLTFQKRPPSKEEQAYVSVPLEEDLYASLLQAVPWVKKK